MIPSTIFSGTHNQLKEVSKKLYLLKGKRKALYVHGTMGIGKTRVMEQVARELAGMLGLEFSMDKKDKNNPKKFCYVPLILHLYDEAETKGVPFPDETRTHTIYLPVGVLPEAGQGLLFLDEMNLARPSILNNGYQLIEEGTLAEYVLPKGYMCIAAGNLVDDRGNTYDVPAPLNNRFFHFLLNPPASDTWIKDFAIPAGLDHRVINYLSYAHQHLYTYNADANVEQIAFATPRMWEKISDVIKDIPTDNLDELEMYIALGVGTGIAKDMAAWLKLSQKYDIEKIFKGEEFTIPTDVGLLFSLTSAIVGYYIDKVNQLKDKAPECKDKASVAVGKMAVDIMTIATKFKKEHAVLLMTQAKIGDPNLHPRIKVASPEMYTKFSKSMFPFLI